MCAFWMRRRFNVDSEIREENRGLLLLLLSSSVMENADT